MRATPLLVKEGSSRKRTGWLKKSRSHLSDGREAHRLKKGAAARAFLNHPARFAAPLLGKEGSVGFRFPPPFSFGYSKGPCYLPLHIPKEAAWARTNPKFF